MREFLAVVFVDYLPVIGPLVAGVASIVLRVPLASVTAEWQRRFHRTTVDEGALRVAFLLGGVVMTVLGLYGIMLR